MKSLGQREQIRTVAERWKFNYCQVGTWVVTQKGDDTKAIYEELLKLDLETCSIIEVEALVGSDRWVRMQECHECAQKRWACLDIGGTVLCSQCMYRGLGVALGMGGGR